MVMVGSMMRIWFMKSIFETEVFFFSLSLACLASTAHGASVRPPVQVSQLISAGGVSKACMAPSLASQQSYQTHPLRNLLNVSRFRCRPRNPTFCAQMRSALQNSSKKMPIRFWSVTGPRMIPRGIQSLNRLPHVPCEEWTEETTEWNVSGGKPMQRRMKLHG